MEFFINGNQAYIGDGVYANFDGNDIWLRTDDDHQIYLEAEVLTSLNYFYYKVIIRKQEQQDAANGATEDKGILE